MKPQFLANDDSLTLEDLEAVKRFVEEIQEKELEVRRELPSEIPDHEYVHVPSGQLDPDQSARIFRAVQFLAYHIEHEFAILRSAADIRAALKIFKAGIERDITDGKPRCLVDGYDPTVESDAIKLTIAGLIKTKLTPMGIASMLPFGAPKSVVEQVALSVAHGVQPGLMPFNADFLVRDLSGRSSDQTGVKSMINCGCLVKLADVLAKYNVLELPEDGAEIRQLSNACDMLQNGRGRIEAVDVLPLTAELLEIAFNIAARYFIRFQRLVGELFDAHHEEITSRAASLEQSNLNSRDLGFNLIDAATVMVVTNASYGSAKDFIKRTEVKTCSAIIAKLLSISTEFFEGHDAEESSQAEAEPVKKSSPFQVRDFSVPEMDF